MCSLASFSEHQSLVQRIEQRTCVPRLLWCGGRGHGPSQTAVDGIQGTTCLWFGIRSISEHNNHTTPRGKTHHVGGRPGVGSARARAGVDVGTNQGRDAKVKEQHDETEARRNSKASYANETGTTRGSTRTPRSRRKSSHSCTRKQDRSKRVSDSPHEAQVPTCTRKCTSPHRTMKDQMGQRPWQDRSTPRQSLSYSRCIYTKNVTRYYAGFPRHLHTRVHLRPFLSMTMMKPNMVRTVPLEERNPGIWMRRHVHVSIRQVEPIQLMTTRRTTCETPMPRAWERINETTIQT